MQRKHQNVAPSSTLFNTYPLALENILSFQHSDYLAIWNVERGVFTWNLLVLYSKAFYTEKMHATAYSTILHYKYFLPALEQNCKTCFDKVGWSVLVTFSVRFFSFWSVSGEIIPVKLASRENTLPWNFSVQY